MLLNKQGRCKYAKRHHDRNQTIPLRHFLHGKSCVNRTPAFQTMDRRKQIYRCIHLINKAYQPFTKTGSIHLRPCKCRRIEQKKEEADDFCNNIANCKTITKFFSLSRNQYIINYPLGKCKHIKQNKWCHKRDLPVNRKFQ